MLGKLFSSFMRVIRGMRRDLLTMILIFRGNGEQASGNRRKYINATPQNGNHCKGPGARGVTSPFSSSLFPMHSVLGCLAIFVMFLQSRHQLEADSPPLFFSQYFSLWRFFLGRIDMNLHGHVTYLVAQYTRKLEKWTKWTKSDKFTRHWKVYSHIYCLSRENASWGIRVVWVRGFVEGLV